MSELSALALEKILVLHSRSGPKMCHTLQNGFLGISEDQMGEIFLYFCSKCLLGYYQLQYIIFMSESHVIITNLLFPGFGSHLELGEFLLAVLPRQVDDVTSSYNINCIKSFDH